MNELLDILQNILPYLMSPIGIRPLFRVRVKISIHIDKGRE